MLLLLILNMCIFFWLHVYIKFSYVSDYFVAFDTIMVWVPLLNGTNFLMWKEALLFHLILMDLNLCFWVFAVPTTSTEESSADVKIQYEKWKRSNRLSLLYMLQHVLRDIRSSVTSETLTTVYMNMIEQ